MARNKRKDEVSPTSGGRRIQIADLIAAKLISPPLALRAFYKGVTLGATILRNGEVVFDGKKYKSLSEAASEAKKSVEKSSQRRNTSGWDFWKYNSRKTNEFKRIDVLRQKYFNKEGLKDSKQQ